MKILTAQQIKKLDAYSIEKQGITSAELMHRAASKCFDWIKHNSNQERKYAVVCGPGNNGGDGLVIAQLLAKSSTNVTCVLLNFNAEFTPDYLYYLAQLKATNCNTFTVEKSEDLEKLDFTNTIVIDAIFGIGLNRPAEGIAAEVIRKINKSQTESVIAIDMPSGLYCDELNATENTIIKANKTLTFHTPKLSFFFPEGGNYPGEIKVLDIGLDKKLAADFESKLEFIYAAKVSNYIKKRLTFTHKGSYGHAHLIAGSRGKMGAAVLATKAASFSGVGLVSATVPSVGLNSVQTRVPVAMCEDFNGENQLSGKFQLQEKHIYGIGPGIGKSEATKSFLKNFFTSINQPVIIDADALNCLAEHPEWMTEIPKKSILTPHVREFERLVGKSKNSKERLDKLIEFCTYYQVFVVLKDARTIIGTPEGKCFFSLNGSPGMATGGSGDVLTGILTGLLAQGYSSEQTTQIGVILHGVAGELAAKKHTEQAMTAESIIAEIGNSFKEINNQ